MRVTRETQQKLILTGGGGTWIVAGCLVSIIAFGAICFILADFDNIAENSDGLKVAGCFLIGGLLMILCRMQVEFTRDTCRLKKWWGLWPGVTLWQMTTSHSGMNRIEIGRIIQQRGQVRCPAFPVILAGGPENIKIDLSRYYTESRQVAEAIARFMGMPLHDMSEGTLVIRQPGCLNESLAERASHKGQQPVLPNPPEKMISSTEDDGQTLAILVPEIGYTNFHKTTLAGAISLFLILSITALSMALFGSKHFIENEKLCIGLFGFLLTIVAAAIAVIHNAIERTLFVVSRESLRIYKKGLFSGKAANMKAKEVEEIIVIPSKTMISSGIENIFNTTKPYELAEILVELKCRISIRSDKKAATVTVPVPLAEAEYIAALVTARLSGVK